jgi:hypothetical protein
LRNQLCQALIYWLQQGKTGRALHQTDQGTTMTFTNQSVDFPVSQPLALFHNRWTRFNTDPIGIISINRGKRRETEAY